MLQPINVSPATNSTFTDISPAELTAGQPDAPVNPLHAVVRNILQAAPLTNDTRAEVWDRVFDSPHSEHLQKHLTMYPEVPDEVKDALVAVKRTTDAPDRDPLENIASIIGSMATMRPDLLELAENHPVVLRSLMQSK